MYNNLIKLVAETRTINKYGDMQVARVERPVFAKVLSIGTNEFYQAAATGLAPEVKFVIADYLDYEGEKVLLFQPFGGDEQEYSVIRTYQKGNTLEITCKRGVD